MLNVKFNDVVSIVDEDSDVVVVDVPLVCFLYPSVALLLFPLLPVRGLELATLCVGVGYARSSSIGPADKLRENLEGLDTG